MRRTKIGNRDHLAALTALVVLVARTLQTSLHREPLLHFLLITPPTPLLKLLRHAALVTCVHVPGLLILQQAPNRDGN
jgi:hypothetical protein